MKEIIDAIGLNRSITRISHEIIERNKGAKDIVLVGIKTRGEYLAKRIAKKIEQFENTKVDFFSLDITPWRDDVLENVEIDMEISISIKDKIVIIVDDVLYSGRTCRAAMEGIIHFGRPKIIQLAILIDRGHRELPIRADYVGKNIPSSKNEIINVLLEEVDGVDGVELS